LAVLHVRNVPDDLYTSLQQRAAAQHRSLSAEVIALLKWATGEMDRAAQFPLPSIRRRRFFEPAAAGAPSSTTLLREDRDR
jgi:plasmid stability protein